MNTIKNIYNNSNVLNVLKRVIVFLKEKELPYDLNYLQYEEIAREYLEIVSEDEKELLRKLEMHSVNQILLTENLENDSRPDQKIILRGFLTVTRNVLNEYIPSNLNFKGSSRQEIVPLSALEEPVGNNKALLSTYINYGLLFK